MKFLPELFEQNRAWAEGMERSDPGFFERLSAQQSPRYLWIGCADSRVPANEICGLRPGEIFVHRNVANLVVHTDFNCLSVLQYAVEALKVSDVIVCGHYGCGGVQAALDTRPLGLIDNWLRNVKDMLALHREELEGLEGRDRANRACELNVKRQVYNLCSTTIIQDAWHRGQTLNVHGWIYALTDGRLRDLDVSASNPDQLAHVHRLSERP